MKYPVYVYPYQSSGGQWVYPHPSARATNSPPYRQQNNRTHLITGLVAGAAITYLLTNRQVQKGISATASKAWGTVRGEVEELKERLADLQAELNYYRNQEKETR